MKPSDLNRRMAGILHVRLPDARLGNIADPRAKRGQLWTLPTILRGAIVGLLAGCKSTAETEDMTAAMTPAIRRHVGIPRRLPSTTLRDAVCQIEPDEIRDSIHMQVRVVHRRKAIEPDRLPFGVLAMDGKVTSLPSCDDHYAQRKTQDDGSVCGLLRTTTCTLVSSTSKICIDAVPIDASTNEMGEFPRSLDSVVTAYRGLDLFRLVSYDAGVTSLANADATCAHGLHYIFALKGTQPTLRAEAERLLSGLDASAASASTEDVVGAASVHRRVYITEQMAGFLDWEHLSTVLRVESETLDRSGKRRAHENRYFLSSLPRHELDDAQWLRVVRLHWAVENNCHNTFDRLFEEDERPWIESSPRGALVVALLRRIAYNLLALFRSVTLRSEEHRATPWRALFRLMYNALVSTTSEQLAGLRARCREPPPAPRALALAA